jgi:hypothetical protein
MDSAAGIGQSEKRFSTGWTAGVLFLAGARNFSLLHSVQAGCETHPASYSVGTMAVPLEVKRLGREANHPFLSSVEVRND